MKGSITWLENKSCDFYLKLFTNFHFTDLFPFTDQAMIVLLLTPKTRRESSNLCNFLNQSYPHKTVLPQCTIQTKGDEYQKLGICLILSCPGPLTSQNFGWSQFAELCSVGPIEKISAKLYKLHTYPLANSLVRIKWRISSCTVMYVFIHKLVWQKY